MSGLILILGGTSDAREIARRLRAAGQAVLLTVVTGYAAELAGEEGEVRVGALTESAFATLLQSARVVVDATHPFAAAVSRLAINGCREHGVPYLRYERPGSALPAHVLLAEDAEEAAWTAVREAHGGTIFLTVGSKTLGVYLPIAREAKCRLIARVLPTSDVLAQCEALGLPPKDVIAMQGPTSRELEIALLRHLDVKVLVTKESGAAGGVGDKIAAAEAAGIPIVVVGRPKIIYPQVVQTVDEVLAAAIE